MSRTKKIKIAICYDYDGTLIKGNMQENSFIPNINMKAKDFWNEVKKHAKENDMDEVLSYMYLMLNKSRIKNKTFNRDSLRQEGKSVDLFPGVDKWFDIINNYAKKLNITVEHYIVSSGLDEMIRGGPIGGKFKHIFASGFTYDANNVPEFPARSINYTTKVQYLFRVNKGIQNSWDNVKVNQFTDKKERPIPFSRMIYIGDGDTDIPAMKMVSFKGGYSIAVHPPKEGQRLNREESKKKRNVQKLQKDNRCQFIAEANYDAGNKLHQIVTSIIDRIADEDKHNMNLKAG